MKKARHYTYLITRIVTIVNPLCGMKDEARIKNIKRSMKRGKKSGKDIDQAAIEKLALELLDPEDPDVISMEGIATLCEKLGIDPASDVRSLVLVWRLGAVSKPGQIQKSEFVEGMKQLGLSDVQGLQNYLPALDPGFLDRSEFREKDVIVQLLPLVLDEQRAPHLSLFLSFLSSCSHTRITLDQWDSFLLFNHNVHVNLDNWEEGGAWPLLLDEYVEWRHKQDSK
eukprot:scaffold268_cov210-Ochromonas_danica.AAC.69